MSPRELEILLEFISKANPPPILHRYRRASPWAIKELSTPEVHLAGIEDMNDPFEYRAPLGIDVEKMKTSMVRFAREHLGKDEKAAELEAAGLDQNSVTLLRERIEGLRRASGLICCSQDPQSNRMWAYYGDSHKGICIGYSSEFSPFSFARKVTYRNPGGSLDLLKTLDKDPTKLSDLVSCRKGKEWKYEQEFRIPVGPIPDDRTRLLPIAQEAIVEVRLGANIPPEFKGDILAAARKLSRPPRIIQMGCNHDTFRLTETEIPAA